MSDAHLMVPPHSADSEAAVLGALLLDNAAFDKVADLINEDDFYTRDNRMMYAAISTMLQRNQPVDIVTLAEYLESRKQLDDCGGVQAIASMVQNTPSAANIRHYAQRVVDKSILRKVASEADEILMRAYHGGDVTGASLLDEAQGKFMAISQRVEKNASSMQGITQVLSQLADHIDENFTKRQAGNDDLVIGLETGLRDLDKMTTGLQGGDFVIVAGRPSMGKTAFAINIAEHVALSLGKPTFIFSLEMSNKQLTNRMLAGVAKVNSQRIWTGRIYDHEWERLTAGIGRLNEAPVHMDDDASLNVNDIKARSRRLHRETGGLGLIVIDYLQLIAPSNARGNRVEDLSEISRELKRLAKELSIPVIALSQLSRAVEQRPNKRPIMSDLRESGAIEQDADVIMFVYRDEYYNPDSADKGTAEIIIAKQRNGPVGTIRANFTKNITKFSDMETPSYMGGDDE